MTYMFDSSSLRVQATIRKVLRWFKAGKIFVNCI